jgi:hypothetical protein
MKVTGTIFVKKNEIGDFIWMKDQKEYYNSLFIFNDNTEYHDTNKRGAGNALMRPYNKYNTSLEKPISAGIPTGSLKDGGFMEFNKEVKKIIDDSFQEIRELIKKYNYSEIIYSTDKDGNLGTNLFEVNKDVIKYITFLIKSLEKI